MKFIHYFVTLLTVILIFVAPATAQAPPSAQQIAQDALPHGVTVDEVALQSALDDLFKSLGNANAAQPTSVSVDNSSLTLASGASTKRLKCPHNGGSQLVVYAWADVSLSHSGFSQIHDKGYTITWISPHCSIWPLMVPPAHTYRTITNRYLSALAAQCSFTPLPVYGLVRTRSTSVANLSCQWW